MRVDTVVGKPLESKSLYVYLASLIHRFFKILPMKENGERSVDVYVHSLQCELLGCQHFLPEFCENESFMALLSVLEFLADEPECPIPVVRREVFKAINICNKLSKRFADLEVDTK